MLHGITLGLYLGICDTWEMQHDSDTAWTDFNT